MADPDVWIIECKHEDPNGFYVKVDGSPYYTGFWLAREESLLSANRLMTETSSELALGKTTITTTALYPEIGDSIPKEVKERVVALADKLTNKKDIRLAAWILSSGEIW